MQSYGHSEYRREQEDKPTGWRSWFGLGDNKDREEDRDYKWSNTTTYRTNPTYPTYGPERYGPTYGPRGGYGYTTTSDDVPRYPSWNTDRDYTTRTGYGTSTDRETRTYGGDYTPTRPSYSSWTPRRDVDRFDYSRPTPRWTGDNTPTSRPFDRECTPSRPYGPTGEYPSYRSTEYRTEYPTTRFDREYPTSRFDREYPTSRGNMDTRFPVTGGDRYNSEPRVPERDYTYTSRWNTDSDYPTTSRSYTGYGSRPYPSYTPTF
jgi:hypothetical protein